MFGDPHPPSGDHPDPDTPSASRPGQRLRLSHLTLAVRPVERPLQQLPTNRGERFERVAVVDFFSERSCLSAGFHAAVEATANARDATVGPMGRTHSTRRDASRAVRSAPAVRLVDIAASSKMSYAELVRCLDRFDNRGRCVEAARAAVAGAYEVAAYNRDKHRSPSDSPKAAWALSRRWTPPPLTRVAAARNDHSPAILAAAAAAAGTAAWVARRVPHPGSTRQSFRSASHEAASRFRRLAAADSSCPRLQLGAFAAADEWYEIRAVVATNPAAGSALAAQMSADPDTTVRAGAVTNPSLPAVLLEAAATDPHHKVRAAAALCSRRRPDLLQRLTSDLYASVRAAVASNPDTAPRTLEECAGDESEDVRAAAASNPKTPATALARLSTDTVIEVAAAVAANPICGPVLLSDLAQRQGAEVRQQIASRGDITAGQLLDLACDHDCSVLLGVARNPLTPASVLEMLASCPDPEVAAAAVLHPNLAPRRAVGFIDDDDNTVRAAARRRYHRGDV